MKLGSISISNYLGTRSFEHQFAHGLTYIVGPNGAGKSTIRDAIRLALFDDLGRLKRKRPTPTDFVALVHRPSASGRFSTRSHIEISCEHGGRSISATVDLQNGFTTRSNNPPESVHFSLMPDKFTMLAPDERRSFLYDLMNVSADPDEVIRFLQHEYLRGVDSTGAEESVDQCLSTVRNRLSRGFQYLCEYAKGQAREFKGEWRGITKGQWGSNVGASWSPTLPDAPSLPKDAQSQLSRISDEVSRLQQSIGAADIAAKQASRRQILEQRIVGLPELETKVLDLGEKLTSLQSQLEQTQSFKHISTLRQRKSLLLERHSRIDDFKASLAACLQSQSSLQTKVEESLASQANSLGNKVQCPSCGARLLYRRGDLYKCSDTELPTDIQNTLVTLRNSIGHTEARASELRQRIAECESAGEELRAMPAVPSVVSSQDPALSEDQLCVMIHDIQRQISELNSNIASARAAQEELSSMLTPSLMADTSSAKSSVLQLTSQADNLRSAINAHNEYLRAVEAAKRASKQAYNCHVRILMWLAIAEAFSPADDAIPARLLSRAILPFNKRLSESARDIEALPKVFLDAEMNIVVDDLPFELLSTSEQWRANALIADAIANISSSRLLVLDDLDVCVGGSREGICTWLGRIASDYDTILALVSSDQRLGLPNEVWVG